MFQIQTLNKIAAIGLNRFGNQYTCGDNVAAPDGVLVRSASMHEMDFPQSLVAIARAGAGVNNIPLDRCSENGIVVFNTPGANANAVKELVLTGLFLASRKIVPAIDWAKTLKGQGDAVGKAVEKGKSAFVGPEITGKTLGVIGLGAIGIMVANAAQALGMNVLGYDPFLSVDAAWKLSPGIRHINSLEEIYENCDYITIHVPLTPTTKGMINANTLATMKDGVRILNFARGDLVDSASLLAAIESGKVATYVTDFPSDEMLCVDGVVAIPHLGASTPESEDNCAVMAVDQMKEYLENGNIRNSVNLPNVCMPRVGDERICIIHQNIPDMIAQVSALCSAQNIHIENMQSLAKKEYAYTMIDVTGSVGTVCEQIAAMDGVKRVRIIR